MRDEEPGAAASNSPPPRPPGRDGTPPARAAAHSARPGPTLRVHIEEIHEQRLRPEALTTPPPGRTVFEALGPRQVVARALRELAHRFDPPWWKFWARRRGH